MLKKAHEFGFIPSAARAIPRESNGVRRLQYAQVIEPKHLFFVDIHENAGKKNN